MRIKDMCYNNGENQQQTFHLSFTFLAYSCSYCIHLFSFLSVSSVPRVFPSTGIKVLGGLVLLLLCVSHT